MVLLFNVTSNIKQNEGGELACINARGCTLEQLLYVLVVPPKLMA